LWTEARPTYFRIQTYKMTRPDGSRAGGDRTKWSMEQFPTAVRLGLTRDLIPYPGWSEENIRRFFELTIKEALSYGLTSIHDADTKLNQIEFFKKMAEAGRLPIHLYLMGTAK